MFRPIPIRKEPQTLTSTLSKSSLKWASFHNIFFLSIGNFLIVKCKYVLILKVILGAAPLLGKTGL